MHWNELFSKEQEPSEDQIKEFVRTPLWDDLDQYLKQTCKVKPKVAHSNCSMDKGMWKGWNVKYQKSGKSLCTLYPKQDYFLALVQVGLRDMNEAELVMPLCSEYTQNLFQQAPSGPIGKFLAFEVTDEAIVNDMKRLVAIRANVK
ncbi:MAG: DUF3788 domain-containing protein [Oscillospiraceae bacterium]|nr:DUF3788 domain-containing protein [Oscillospiraceae bacterium]